MPEYSVSDSIITSLHAQEPWPDNVKLFQPYEVEQILLPDNASCLAVQAFLKMCNLPFEVEMRWNAEFMSPSGRVPFIKCGAFVVSELEPIVQFAANKGVSLCSNLSTEEKAEMRAYMSLITNVLVNAELYISWLDKETFNAVTKVRNSSVYPWPLGWFQTRTKRNAVAKRLKALLWHDKTLEQILADVEQCCNSLSQRLANKDFFFETPTPLDALMYGHIRALLSDTGPKAGLMIKPLTSSLLRHLLRMVTLTKMKLTYQEEYLITQAFQIARRLVTPVRTSSERNARIGRSKMSLRSSRKDDAYGFKPFAAKQIKAVTSKRAHITFEYDRPTYDHYHYNAPYEESYAFITDIVNDLNHKVDNITSAKEKEKHDNKELESDDFEVIPYTKEQCDDTLANFGKQNDFNDSVDDIDSLGNDSSIRCSDDVFHVGDDVNSEGIASEKLMDSDKVMNDDYASETTASPDLLDTSDDLNLMKSEVISFSGSRCCLATSDNISVVSDSKTVISTESNATLKMPSGDVSVECLLQYFRRRNAIYNISPMIADVD